MTKIYALLLLAIYNAQLIFSIIPWVDYAVNFDYIVENICIERNNVANSCNGSCHLNKELQKIDKQENSTGKNTPEALPTVKSEPFVLGFIVRLISLPESIRFKYYPFKNNYSYQFLSSSFHPPEA